MRRKRIYKDTPEEIPKYERLEDVRPEALPDVGEMKKLLLDFYNRLDPDIKKYASVLGIRTSVLLIYCAYLISHQIGYSVRSFYNYMSLSYTYAYWQKYVEPKLEELEKLKPFLFPFFSNEYLLLKLKPYVEQGDKEAIKLYAQILKETKMPQKKIADIKVPDVKIGE